MNRIAPRAGLLAALLGASAGAVSALDPMVAPTQYGRRVWTTEQGLPQNTIRAIVQARDGYLWLGTQEGLVRFDGIRFSVFDEKNTPAIKDRYVLSLHEDHVGTLWIGTRGGGLVRYRDGAFSRFDASSGLPNDVIRCIHEDRSGRLWVGTDGGVVRMEDDHFVVPPGLNTRSFAVMAITEADGVLWLATDGDGLLRVGDAVEKYGQEQGLSNNHVRALSAGRDGSLWIGTRAGLDRWKGGQLTRQSPPGAPWEAIGAIVEDRDGNLWVGTRGQGLARLTSGQRRTVHPPDGLTGDVVFALFEDREGSLWIGTDGAGLSRLQSVKVVSFGKAEGLAHDMLLPITEDRQGNVWMGSYGGGSTASTTGSSAPSPPRMACPAT